MATFIEVEVQHKSLRSQVERGELSQEQFLQQAAQLMCQDEAGRWWTIHPESGMWHYRWRDEWRPGVPPGHTPGAVREAPPPAAPPAPAEATVVAPSSDKAKSSGCLRWLLPALVALVLVSVVAALVFLVVLPRLGGDSEPAATPAATEVVQVTQATNTNTPLPASTFTPAPTATSSPEPSLTPTASSTPEPTSTPTATPLPQGPDAALAQRRWPETAWQGAIVDDFSQFDSGWSRGMGEGSLVDYREGQLRIELQGTESGLTAWSRYEPESFDDGWVEVTVVEMASAAGIALHVTEDYHGYVFRIDSDGRYSIGRTLPDAEPPLVDWTFSERIYTAGKPNQLAVMADGNSYTFFINGWRVAAVEDEAYPSGRLALWGGTGAAGAAQVAFDDCLLLAASPLPPADATPTETPAEAGTATWTPFPKATKSPSPATATPTTQTTTSPIPPTATSTTAASQGPLTFEVSYDTWYPGSGSNWIIRFHIQAQGGDGNYTYQVEDRTFTTDVFDFEWGCGASLAARVEVRSGDGQSAFKNVWIEHVPCVAP